MRMWMVNPRILCRKHLLGEHVELHMFVGTIKTGVGLDGYVRNNLVEPLSIEKRHNDLVKEMERRGMNHKSDILKQETINILLHKYYTDNVINAKVDTKASLKELLNRCFECYDNYMILTKKQICYPYKGENIDEK